MNLAIYQHCSKEEVFRDYVTLYLEYAKGYIPFHRDFGQEAHATTIDTINELFDLNIQVYMPQNNGTNELKLANQMQTEGEIINIVHNGINHFSGLKIVNSPNNSVGFNQKSNSNIINSTVLISNSDNNDVVLDDKTILNNLEQYKERNKNNPALCRAMENVVMRTLGCADGALTTSGAESHKPIWKIAQNKEPLDKKAIIDELTTSMRAENRYLYNIPEEKKEEFYEEFLKIINFSHINPTQKMKKEAEMNVEENRGSSTHKIETEFSTTTSPIAMIATDLAAHVSNITNASVSANYAGSKTTEKNTSKNVQQTKGPFVNSGYMPSSLSEGFANAAQNIGNAAGQMAQPLLFSPHRAAEITRGLSQAITNAGRAGIINGLLELSRAGCSLDGLDGTGPSRSFLNHWFR